MVGFIRFAIILVAAGLMAASGMQLENGGRLLAVAVSSGLAVYALFAAWTLDQAAQSDLNINVADIRGAGKPSRFTLLVVYPLYRILLATLALGAASFFWDTFGGALFLQRTSNALPQVLLIAQTVVADVTLSGWTPHWTDLTYKAGLVAQALRWGSSIFGVAVIAGTITTFARLAVQLWNPAQPQIQLGDLLRHAGTYPFSDTTPINAIGKPEPFPTSIDQHFKTYPYLDPARIKIDPRVKPVVIQRFEVQEVLLRGKPHQKRPSASERSAK